MISALNSLLRASRSQQRFQHNATAASMLMVQGNRGSHAAHAVMKSRVHIAGRSITTDGASTNAHMPVLTIDRKDVIFQTCFHPYQVRICISLTVHASPLSTLPFPAFSQPLTTPLTYLSLNQVVVVHRLSRFSHNLTKMRRGDNHARYALDCTFSYARPL